MSQVRLHASARFRIASRWQVAAFKAERMSLDCSECMLVRLSGKVLESYENNRRVDNECVGLPPCALPPPLGGLQVLLWSIERSNRCRTASHTPSHHVVRRMNICGRNVRKHRARCAAVPVGKILLPRAFVACAARDCTTWVQHPCRSEALPRRGGIARAANRESQPGADL
jgi:hypothetical protein